MLQVMSEFPFFDPLFCDILIFSLQMMTATINKPTPFATKSSYSFFYWKGISNYRFYFCMIIFHPCSYVLCARDFSQRIFTPFCFFGTIDCAKKIKSTLIMIGILIATNKKVRVHHNISMSCCHAQKAGYLMTSRSDNFQTTESL
jgi:hypothetical protein